MRSNIISLLGPFLALFGLFALSPVIHLAFGKPAGPTLPGLVAEWLLAWTVLFVAFRVDHLPVASLGIKPFRWPVVPLGIALGIGLIMIGMTVGLIERRAGLNLSHGASRTLELLRLPLAWRIVIPVTAGVVEEILYRGYAIESLTRLFGHRRPAALLSLVIFALGHVFFWGWPNAIGVLFIGAVLTVVYLRYRNLLLNIIAHITTDAIPLLILPTVYHLHH